jgi:exosome complex protein LRP1
MAHPLDQLEDIDELLDALTEKLQPLIKTPVHDHANKLPVADKARLYVLTTYALQSLLFCSSPAPLPSTPTSFGHH